jgi:hypothetical protein
MPIIVLVVTLLLQLAIDGYWFMVAMRRTHRGLFWPKAQLWASGFFVLYIIVLWLIPHLSASDTAALVQMWMWFIYLSIYLFRLVGTIFDMLSKLPRLWSRRRWPWLSKLGVVAATALLLTLWWGALINRYQVQVRAVVVDVENLPESFDGYRIAQISDLHLGGFGSDTTFVHSLVEQVNALRPDLIVFTGDIVTRRASELEPMVSPLSRLQSRDGVVSILGNHDYGDYCRFDDPLAKEENIEWLMDLQIEMGWELLTNSTTWRYGDIPGDSIAIIGMHNWGEPPFSTLGNLQESYPTLGDSVTKILLTHNPEYWRRYVAHNPKLNIALTLSGHTHAMQIQLGNFSPAMWRYPTWGGLYQSADGRRPLYVNIGAGEVGWPARIGARPEITLITLNKPHKSNPTK